MKTNRTVKFIISVILKVSLSLLLFISILGIFSANYLLNYWGEIEFATVLYQLNSPLRGTNTDIIEQYLNSALYPSVVVFSFLIFVWLIFFKLSEKLQCIISGRVGNCHFSLRLRRVIPENVRKKIKIFIYPGIVVILCILLVQKSVQVGLHNYLANIIDSSTIFEEEYVEPKKINIKFKTKQNLIYIYLESMETTYADKENGGEKENNYIPNLTQLANNNISFSHSNKLGGMFSVYGADWTMGALLGSTSGIPYKLPIGHNSAQDYQEFLPGITTLGEILAESGYKNYFMCGSDANFGGRQWYFQKHGEYEIIDYYTAIKDNIVQKDYYEFWGIEDKKLYDYAKDKLTEISKSDEPFNFTLLTVDTHNPEGYICDICDNKYPQQYGNSIVCADRQVNEFINWAKEQDWYNDTTIVILGDHLSMNNTFFDEIEVGNRKVYNCIINSVIKPVKRENRVFCILDMFPTVLAAMGAEIEGDRLGLGTNLFSERITLSEEMGMEDFNSQLSRHSSFYNRVFINTK